MFVVYADLVFKVLSVLIRRTTCLKYLVLANMLMKSGINPFDSQEAKPYKNDPEILAMTNLVRYDISISRSRTQTDQWRQRLPNTSLAAQRLTIALTDLPANWLVTCHLANPLAGSLLCENKLNAIQTSTWKAS